jgi:hypothetical protein
MRATILLTLSLTLILAACSKPEAKQSYVQDAGPEIHNFQIPNEQDPTLAMQSDLDMGSYTATSIRITRLESGIYAGSKWTMIHTFNKPGSPAKGDPILKRGDWVGVTTPISSTVHQQVPMQVTVVEDGGLEYKTSIYHGESMGSDGRWSWRWSEDTFGADVLFLLSTKITGVSDQGLLNPAEPMVTLEDDHGNQVDRLTHKVQTLVSTIGTQTAAVRKVDANTFVVINYIQDQDGTQVYSEITYAK